MKILVITDTDSANLHLAPICRKLRERGHILSVYGGMTENSIIRGFTEIGFSVKPIGQLNDSVLNENHIILCGKNYPPNVIFFNKYIFQHDFTPDWFVESAADFTFSRFSDEMPRVQLRRAKMPIGDTMNCSLEDCDYDDEKNQILYIDSGHHPFSYDGKLQVADMLLRVCEENPDYEIVIKPRWLRNYNGPKTHRNIMHIYDVIEERCDGNLPENLTMLNEHVPMNHLIQMSHSVITLTTGAIIDVLQSRKGLCIVNDFTAEDRFEVRLEKQMAIYREYYSRSGCAVNLSDIPKHMPHGIKPDGNFLKKVLPDVDDSCTKAAEVMEYVYDHYIKHGKYPTIKNYHYDTYMDEMTDSGMSFSEIRQIRFENKARKFIAQSQDPLSVELSFSEAYDYIHKHYADYPFTPAGLAEFGREYNRLKNKTLRDNRDLLMSDPINQDFLLRALYEMGYYDDILTMRPENILATGPHNYYSARVLLNRAYTEKGLANYVAFLNEANSKSYEQYRTELTNEEYRAAYIDLFKRYNGENLPPHKICEAIDGLHQSKRTNILPSDLHSKVYQNVYSAEAEAFVSEESKLIYLAGKWILSYEKQMKESEIKRLNGEIKRLNDEIKRLKGGGEVKRLNARIKDLNDQITKMLQNKPGIWNRLRRGFRYLHEHGLRSTIREKVIKRLLRPFNIPVQLWKHFKTNVLAGFQVYSCIMNDYGAKAYLYLAAASIGDNYALGAKFNAFCARQPSGQASVWLAYKEGGKKVAQLFGINNVVPIDFENYRKLYSLLMFDGKMIRCYSLHPHVISRHTGIISRLWGFRGTDFISLNTAFAYGDIQDYEAQAPVFSSDGVDEYIRECGLTPNNTVILSPYAKSVKFIPVDFWNKLAEKLVAKGYDVVTNCSSQTIFLHGSAEPIYENPIEGTKGICASYDILVPLLEKVVGLIALRSGMQDVSESADCLNVSLQHKQGRYPVFYGSLNDVYSMKNIYKRPNMHDLLYTTETQYALIDQIVSIVVGYTNK